MGQTILDAWREFRTTKEKAGRSHATLDNYEDAINALVKRVEPIDLEDLTTEMLEDFLNAMYKRPGSRRTRQRQLYTFLQWCVRKRDWIEKNPAARLESITVVEEERQPFTPDELGKLRDRANLTERTALEYLLFLRPSEFLVAEVGYVDVEARSMRVYRRKLHKWVNIEATDEMIEYREGLRKWGGSKSEGQILTARNKLEAWFKEFASLAGVPEEKRIPYILRHTGATMWAAKYRDPFRLMNQMGWSRIQRAQTYVHQAERSAWAAVFPRVDLPTLNEKLDRILSLLERMMAARG